MVVDLTSLWQCPAMVHQGELWVAMALVRQAVRLVGTHGTISHIFLSPDTFPATTPFPSNVVLSLPCLSVLHELRIKLCFVGHVVGQSVSLSALTAQWYTVHLRYGHKLSTFQIGPSVSLFSPQTVPHPLRSLSLPPS